MTYKDILVHLDGSPRSQGRLKLAAALAAEHEAYLTALHVVELPSPALFMGDTSIFDIRLSEDIFAQMRQQGEVIAQRVEQDFRAALREYGVSGEWRVEEDVAADAVARHGRYADLVIVGQSDPDRPLPNQRGIPELAVLTCGRPVLVIPYIGAPAGVGRTVLVGWKSRPEAARAVNDAIPVLRRARAVTVLAIDPEQGVSDDEDVPAADIARHLARHGVHVTASHQPSGGIDQGDVLLNAASDMGADLIVVGGYGHSRASEFVFGGVTRTLLVEMTVPVLFSH